MLTLKLFGAASIETSDGPITGRAAQGRRLALLALLALARGRAVRRDKIIALLWPESSTERARHQLSDDLYIIRTALGDDVIRSSGDELSLNPDSITSDAATFERLLDEGQLETAVGLYAGPLLDGFHVPDSAELDHWLDGERSRLGHRYTAALEALAEASESRGETGAAIQAVHWWRKLAAVDPANGRIALRLMRALDSAGDRAGALRHARAHGELLRAEFDVEPDAEVTAFAQQLRVDSRARPETQVESAPLASSPRGRDVAVSHDEDANVRSASSVKARVPKPGRSWWPLGIGAVAVLLLAVVIAAVRGGAAPQPPARPSASVGVLPFANMSPQPDDAYLGDGLTEQIITTLSRVDGLRVAARTSSFALRDGKLDVRAIGDTLGVATVLEGSLRRDGNRLRITAQLIDVATGYHIWADHYDREIADILTMQDEIASAIAGALELRLASDSAQPVAARPMPDLETYDLYLRGLYLRNNLRADALAETIGLLDRAIARQPDFALAYAAKASVIGPQIMFGHVPQQTAVEALRAVTTRALELDPNLSEAYAALGMLKLFFDWDWAGAERALRRAIQLNPNDAHAYHHLASTMRVMGRFGEAIAARSRAVELDPLNARTTLILGEDYLVGGQPDRALVAYRRGVQLDPVNALALGSGPFIPLGPAQFYRRQGRDREAVEEYLRIATLRRATSGELDALRAGFAKSGWSGFWRSWLAMDLRQSGGKSDAVQVAGLWALSGDTAQALDWLERAWREHNAALVYVKFDARFESLRGNPRFARIVSAMKLP